MRAGFALAIAFALFFLIGCCGYTEPGKGNTPPANNENQPPFVDIQLNITQGAAPFYPKYSFWCRDTDNNLDYCELRMDGKAYARGANQNSVFPDDYARPSFYDDAVNSIGKHTIEIFAMDKKGLNSSKIVEFTVLPGAPITKPGWYRCNDYPNREPCTTFLDAYCGKFTPQDLAVRKAASAAIEKHPGAFSINQLLDIYDYVHSNVFYQNVPLDMFPPYSPNETLATGSGDCKNQAVLIASMVEAIGGSARVLLVPSCQHAFAEVYAGTDIDRAALDQAVFWHYNTADSGVTWHTSKNADNQTETWFIFDTAGGSYPGNTIPECVKPNTTTYEIRDCGRQYGELQAPRISGTELGPNTLINDTRSIQPGWSRYYWQEPKQIGKSVKWCRYKLNVASRSPTPLTWYYTDAEGYRDWDAGRSFSYYHSEAQVKESAYEFDRTTPDKFYIILKNADSSSALTSSLQLVETCYNN